MIVQPLGPPPRDTLVVVVTDAGHGGVRMATDDGQAIECLTSDEVVRTFNVLAQLRATIYNLAPQDGLLTSCGYQHWRCQRWGNRITHYYGPGNAKVLPLSRFAAHSDQIFALAEWARGKGVAMGSLPTMSRHLWRRTLAEPVALGGISPLRRKVGASVLRRSLWGGRKEARPGRYWNMDYLDMAGAYATASTCSPLPVALAADGTSIAHGDGIAFADVKITDHGYRSWGPLPVEQRENHCRFPRSGEVTGYWPLGELRTAAELGHAVVRVEQVWRATSSIDLRPWRELVATAPDPMRKVLAATLWSSFCPQAKRCQTATWDAEGKVVWSGVTHRPDPWPTPWGLAAEVTSRVRTRLLTEGLVATGAVYADCDGVWVPAGTTAPGWRVKRHAAVLDVYGPQVLSWDDKLSDRPRPYYQVSGADCVAEAARIIALHADKVNVEVAPICEDTGTVVEAVPA